MNNKENSIKRLGSKYMILLSALLSVFAFSVQAASPLPVADGRTDMLTTAHSMSNVAQPVVITEYYTYQYDNAARLSAVTHRLNNGSTVTLTANSYDAIGRITQDSCNGSSPLLTSLATSLQPVKPPTPGNLFTTDTVSYCGNVVFGGDSIRYILVDGGYVTSPLTAPEYHFYLRDHLGSNRVVCSSTGAVEQKNHSYPYGMPMDASTSASSQPYKYNGKELVRSAGLNWLDYGARWHDPILGRWHSMDSRCEKNPSITPYSYCHNDPLNRIDPDGNDDYYSKSGMFIERDDKETDHIVIRKAQILLDFGNMGSFSFNIDEPIENTVLSAEAYSNIFTNILSQMSGVNINELHNHKVSVTVWNYSNDNIGKYTSNQSNDAGLSDDTLAETASFSNGERIITAYVYPIGSEEKQLLSTVSNVQNLLGAHEFFGHYKNGWHDHDRVVSFQRSHSTWSKTTNHFKEYNYAVYGK